MTTELLKDENVNNEKQQVNDAFELGFILELKR